MQSPISHIKRVLLILVLALIGGLTVRFLLIPDSFGKYGHYRGDALSEEAAREISHSEEAKCGTTECHEVNAIMKEDGKHKPVACENCHGAFAFHPKEKNADPNKFGINRERSLCITCHRKEPARPSDFRMIVVEEHYFMGDESPPCITCHNPHTPSMT